jgi:hypothetical protein
MNPRGDEKSQILKREILRLGLTVRAANTDYAGARWQDKKRTEVRTPFEIESCLLKPALPIVCRGGFPNRFDRYQGGAYNQPSMEHHYA